MRDYEARPDRSEAMIDLMTRRVTGENTPHMARHLNPGTRQD